MSDIITYLRSSSYNNWDFCEMQYFLSYVLGIPRDAGKKADKGTVVHKVMECLALLKKNYDEHGNYIIEDSIIGKFVTEHQKFLQPHKLDNDSVNQINKTRSSEYTYKMPCRLSYNHIRYGVEVVQELFDRAYTYYSSKSNVKWSNYDYNDCQNFIWIILDYKNGIFDPRKRKIVQAEPHFDIPIEREWAKIGNDYLRIKGTVDLLTEVEPGILEVIDWKTGQRKDWGNDKRKDYPYLCRDFQLMLYYYAIKHLYPDTKTILVSIFFVRDGGPFTMCFDDSTLELVEEKIKARYNEIRTCVIPKQCDPTHEDKKCSKFCEYLKMLSPEGNNNMCDFIHNKIATNGIDEVRKMYTHEGFTVGNYDAPGGE